MFSLNPYIDLYVLFLLLYLWECVVFVRPHQLLFWTGVSGLFTRMQMCSPDSLYEFSKGSVMPASIFPFSYSLAARLPLLSACEQGIIVGSVISLARKRKRKPRVVIPWTAEPDFSDGRIVWNSRSIVSGLSIEELARLKEEWKVLIEANDEVNDAGNYGDSQFSAKRLIAPDEIERIVEKERTVRQKLRPLLINTILYFLYLFVMLPIFGFSGVFVESLPGILAIFTLFAVAQAVLFFVTARKILQRSRLERFFQALLIFVAPPYALRSAQRLYAAALSDESAVTVGLALLKERERDAMVDCMIRDLKHPIHDEAMIEKANAGRAEKEWLIALESIADRSVGHPATNDTGRICPRCLQLYELNAKECPDCLVRF